VSVNSCVTVPTELFAVIVNIYAPTGVSAATVIKPFALLMLTPDGASVNEYTIVVLPVAVTWNVPPVPFTTPVLF
jgi:hypothetical protein